MSELILVWTPGKGSPIHDHANAHCVMKVCGISPARGSADSVKVLKGTLRETLYEWPDAHSGPLQIQRDTEYGPDAVTYMSDTVGDAPDDGAVTGVC